MKSIVKLFLLALIAVQAAAIPPRRVAFPVTQSDGTTLMVMKFGDGHLAFYATQDGITLQRSESGDLCYACLENGVVVSSGRIAHDVTQRSSEESDYVRTHALRVDNMVSQRMLPRRTSRPRVISASTSDGLGSYGKSGMGGVNSIGNYTLPVLMVQFKDIKFKSTTTAEKMTRFYNEVGYQEESKCVGSVRDYFKSQSNGLFVPTFEVVGTVTLPQNHDYYGGNVTSGPWKDYDKGLCADNYFVVDAVKLAQSQGIDFSRFAVNGRVPLICLLYAGRGEATEYYGGEDYIWPCEDDIDQNIGGTHFNSYFVGNELDGDGSLMGMGVFCHEFGHALGLPDFYVTDYSYTDTNPVGEWSIMDMGAYVQEARAPMGYTAYERSYLGWLDIPELTEAEAVTLDSYSDLAQGEATPARLLRNPSNQKEYFIFENHQPGTWYPASYGSGMLVMRICYDKNAWEENTLNNTKSKQRIKLITANGRNPSASGSNVAELFSYNGKAVNVENWALYGGTKLAKPFYNIQNAGGKVKFNFLAETINVKEVGDTVRDGDLVYVITANGEVELVASDVAPYSGAVIVPETATEDGVSYSVVGVADAFKNCTELSSVSLPKTVSIIDADAFAGTPKLDNIIVDEKNKSFRTDDYALEMILREEHADNVRAAKAGENTKVVFDFAANPWNLPTSSAVDQKAGTLTDPVVMGEVTMTATSGSTVTRLWKGSSTTDLRVYNGGSLTFSVPDGMLINAINVTASKWDMTADEGTLEGKAWTGEAQEVTFSAQGTTTITKVELTLSTDNTEKVWAVIAYPAARSGSCVLSEGVATILASVFKDTKVSEVTLPASLSELEAGALSTSSLTKLTVLAPIPPACKANPFEAVDKVNCRLVIPDGSEEAYRAAEYWKEFFDLTGITSVIPARPSNGEAYDLQGRRLSNSQQKGVYILGGKKIIR